MPEPEYRINAAPLDGTSPSLLTRSVKARNRRTSFCFPSARFEHLTREPHSTTAQRSGSRLPRPLLSNGQRWYPEFLPAVLMTHVGTKRAGRTGSRLADCWPRDSSKGPCSIWLLLFGARDRPNAADRRHGRLIHTTQPWSALRPDSCEVLRLRGKRPCRAMVTFGCHDRSAT